MGIRNPDSEPSTVPVDDLYAAPWAAETAAWLVKMGFTPSTRIAFPDDVRVGARLDDIGRAPKIYQEQLAAEYTKRKNSTVQEST